MVLIDKTWHLAQEEKEIEVTNFELQLWRVFYGFIDWQQECEKAANNSGLTGNELSVLHVIRMKDRPKSISDIGKILNRTDAFNIHYSIRKLIKKKLVRKTSNNKAYEITEEGIRNTDLYTQVRKNTLIELYAKNHDLNLGDLASKLARLKSIYDDAAQMVIASYGSPTESDEKEKQSNDSTREK